MERKSNIGYCMILHGYLSLLLSKIRPLEEIVLAWSQPFKVIIYSMHGTSKISQSSPHTTHVSFPSLHCFGARSSMGKTLSLFYENQHLWARNEALNLLLFLNKTPETNIWNPSLILAQKPTTSNSFQALCFGVRPLPFIQSVG